MKQRCEWAQGSRLYIDYHDNEWGVPVHDDNKLFEFLVLEGAQAGLSWTTILKKRQCYVNVYDHFDVRKIACYDDTKIQELLGNPGIVRNRRKVLASIHNARAFLSIQEEFGSFDTYIWRFVDGKPIQNAWKRLKEIGCVEHVFEETRIFICRHNDLLCVHTGSRDGKRPCGRLFQIWGVT